MPDDRDTRRPKTPPAGVAAQIAPAESWEDEHTGNTPVSAIKDGETAVETIVRRSADTKNAATRTLTGMRELHGRVGNLEESFGAFKTEVKTELQEQRKQNATIIGMTGDIAKALGAKITAEATVAVATATVTAETALAENEVRKAERLATVEIKREAWKKAIRIVGAIVLAAIAAITAYLKLSG